MNSPADSSSKPAAEAAVNYSNSPFTQSGVCEWTIAVVAAVRGPGRVGRAAWQDHGMKALNNPLVLAGQVTPSLSTEGSPLGSRKPDEGPALPRSLQSLIPQITKCYEIW